MDDQTKADEIENMNANIQSALDPSVPLHVAEECWKNALHTLRKYDAGIDWIKPVYASDTSPEVANGRATRSPVGGTSDEDIVIQFGKYKGKTLGQIVESDEQYFVWLVHSGAIRVESVREAAERIASRNSL